MSSALDISLSLLKSIRLKLTGENRSFNGECRGDPSQNSTGVDLKEDDLLSMQDYFYVLGEVRKANKTHHLSECLRQTTQDMCNRLTNNTLSNKEKRAVVNFLCESGVLQMQVSTTVIQSTQETPLDIPHNTSQVNPNIALVKTTGPADDNGRNTQIDDVTVTCRNTQTDDVRDTRKNAYTAYDNDMNTQIDDVTVACRNTQTDDVIGTHRDTTQIDDATVTCRNTQTDDVTGTQGGNTQIDDVTVTRRDKLTEVIMMRKGTQSDDVIATCSNTQNHDVTRSKRSKCDATPVSIQCNDVIKTCNRQNNDVTLSAENQSTDYTSWYRKTKSDDAITLCAVPQADNFGYPENDDVTSTGKRLKSSNVMSPCRKSQIRSDDNRFTKFKSDDVMLSCRQTQHDEGISGSSKTRTDSLVPVNQVEQDNHFGSQPWNQSKGQKEQMCIDTESAIKVESFENESECFEVEGENTDSAMDFYSVANASTDYNATRDEYSEDASETGQEISFVESVIVPGELSTTVSHRLKHIHLKQKTKHRKKPRYLPKVSSTHVAMKKSSIGLQRPEYDPVNQPIKIHVPRSGSSNHPIQMHVSESVRSNPPIGIHASGSVSSNQPMGIHVSDSVSSNQPMGIHVSQPGSSNQPMGIHVSESVSSNSPISIKRSNARTNGSIPSQPWSVNVNSGFHSNSGSHGNDGFESSSSSLMRGSTSMDHGNKELTGFDDNCPQINLGGGVAGVTTGYYANISSGSVEFENTVNPNECPICQKRFKHKQYLKQHIKMHSSQRAFKCKFCPWSFVSQSHLRTHMTKHTGERPHHCSICGKSFQRVADLNRHIKMHSTRRPFACKFCQGSFVSPSHLRIHMTKHTGERMHNCGMCGKSFQRIADLNRHTKMHELQG